MFHTYSLMEKVDQIFKKLSDQLGHSDLQGAFLFLLLIHNISPSVFQSQLRSVSNVKLLQLRNLCY